MNFRHLLLPLLFAMTSAALNAGELSAIPLKTIDGEAVTLAKYKGQVLLIVNVASECGYTPQYEGLEALYRKYKDRGLVVLGFPSNDFGGQEPGTEAEIKAFCSSRYQVSFPLFAKLHAIGPEQHPLYAELTGPGSTKPGPVQWNFTKFLIGRDGKLVDRWGSSIEPEDAKLRNAIEAALK